MSELQNVALLAADAVLYFALLAALFRWRRKIGVGAFFCALGVMHFLETYLAIGFYVSLPSGIVTSPGSTVLFAGKLMFLLLVYVREDAVVVRQPIYGLLFGNLLVLAMAYLLRQHELVTLDAARVASFGFVEEMGALMVWGTALLFVDSLLIILLYERSRDWLGDRMFPRLALAGAAVLTFDQVGFWAGLAFLTDAPLSVLVGGWIAKMGSVAVFATLVGLYLRFLEHPAATAEGAPSIADVFGKLTYRERYEDLLARTGKDALTGVFDRGRLEEHGRNVISEALDAGRPASLLLVDVDRFKSVNDRFGHAAGDRLLAHIAAAIVRMVRGSDLVFRFGGEEFVVICDRLPPGPGLALAERIRREVAANGHPDLPEVTVSVGIATAPGDAGGYDDLFAVADKRLYQAKSEGRNRVVGAPRSELAAG